MWNERVRNNKGRAKERDQEDSAKEGKERQKIETVTFRI